ncbi:Lin1244/Lin1753 domain-containing protein [Polynucleobacter sp.]|uniref:Lin1244/Lin1753 domain-containing protein n=1 Tax=Polynucleobacter sp. TaxID=2029855 RepID=UPI003F6A1491
MKKDAYYFSHDANARHDIKLISFCSKYKSSGYAYFFMAIEMLREQANYKLPLKLKASLRYLWGAYGDAISDAMAEEILIDMISIGLLSSDENGDIYSESLNHRMEKLNEFRKKLSDSGKAGAEKRWGGHKPAITTPMALKESIVNKVNKSNENRYVAFAPPTHQDVKDYCESRGNLVDSQKFLDFYQSKGWMVGKNKMKDWKACVRTWEKSETQKGGGSYGNKTKPGWSIGVNRDDLSQLLSRARGES